MNSQMNKLNHPFTQNKCFYSSEIIKVLFMDRIIAFLNLKSSFNSLLTVVLVKNQAYSYISGLRLIISVPDKAQRHFEASPTVPGGHTEGEGRFVNLVIEGS